MLTRKLHIASISIVAFAILVLFPASSFAHVRIDPSEGTKGGDGSFVITVPNERAAANTNNVQFVFPEEYPISSIVAKDIPGWTTIYTNFDKSEEIKDITFIGGNISGENKAEFTFTFYGLPSDVDQIFIKVIQGYDNNEIVRWIDEPQADGAEPEHPAAVLNLVNDSTTNSIAETTTTEAEEQSSMLKKTVSSTSTKQVEKAKEDNGPTLLVYLIVGAGLIVILFLGIRFLKNAPTKTESTEEPDQGDKEA